MSVAKIVAWLALGALLTTAGCGKSGDLDGTQAAASINSSLPAGGAAGGASRSDPLHPVVVIETSLGQITVVLDKESAPLTVDNFLNYVDQGFYDKTIFHQVLKDYVVLGGAFTGDLKEKPTSYPVRNEARNGQKNLRGTIAMARRPDDMDSATCQFFINVTDNPMLDYQGDAPETYGYCAFGKVTEGMEVVDRIASVPVQDQQGEISFERIPVETVMIHSVRRIR